MEAHPEDWTRVKAVLQRAMELEGAARSTYVADACAHDAEVRQQVERLLAAHDRAPTSRAPPALTMIDVPPDALVGQLVSIYRIEELLGRGGMGEVYKAHDAKLNRSVALKLLPINLAHDTERLRRFRAEALALSSLNHPHILVVHDVGDHDGRPFIVTEYVEGLTLRQHLMGAGALPMRDLIDVAVQISSALMAAHRSGVLHRDIKPENVMIRPDGYVKVLDFGLAKLAGQHDRDDAAQWRTRQGLIMGTPQYMSPEQARAEQVDFRSDQFSFGALLYELATGRPPFARRSLIETAAAVINDQPDALGRVCPQMPPTLCIAIQRCMEKEPSRRYDTTHDMHRDLLAVREHPIEVTTATPPNPGCDAIVVMPLRILRSHPDADFLAFSLPDAIAASLADRHTIAVRAPLAVQRHGGADADLVTLADAMAAQFALTGTLACVESRIAVRLQLLAIPAGTVMWSDARVATLQEMFELQDAVAAHVARTLPGSVVATHAGAQIRRDVPNSAGGYAFYLRANQLAYEVSHWHEARDLYRACLDADPLYAPAWARLARCERLIGKFSASADESKACLASAREAFERGLALNPDLAVGHGFHAELLIDVGRADEAMRLLLERLVIRPNDPDLYAGLVPALRFCGLLDESVAAHARTRSLDPTVPTSIHHTWWMKGEYTRALAETYGDIGYMQGLALASLGREREAVAALRWREGETTESRIRPYLASLRALLENDRDKSLAALESASALQTDAEALYYLARTFARLGEGDRATRELQRVVEGGFWCHHAFVRDRWLDPIRPRGDVQQLLERSREQSQLARASFVRWRGPSLLGLAITNASR